ncbi:photosystem reaction center subunit H [Phyllobacterium brassicacearum]|uniref:Photosystem reaction center subunit H n=1 Tax=Phyllobacterium brassicacearum TaxID=314235 RepID=A0A2P7BP61_9HYPH|nr:PRC-barrel domain-containing protein [Phyllobacterium brassicacearum]PSH68258.1 photosystem reaction center subunit H [Phyllobacterium brassicacearum]TDQ29638.1 PRC-barrel domain protein [Phyllobacterium brassicacearum]
MMKNLIATAACVALMSGTALAQTAPAPAETPAPLTVTNKELFKPSTGTMPAAPDASAMTTASEGQILASGFLGKSVYSGDGDNAETIGKLNDLVIGPDGMVQAAVIGVGGFLGVGQKDVAVAPDQLKLSIRSDGNSWLVLNTTKDQLNAAPSFERSANFTDGIADPMKTGSTSAPAVPDAPK